MFTNISQKQCKRCGKWKSKEEYHKHNSTKDGLFSTCKDCERKKARDWYNQNKERGKKVSLSWYHNNKEKAKAKPKATP